MARNQAITSALSGLHLGDTMRRYLAQALRDLSPAELTDVLTAGIRNDEVKGGHGLVTSLLDPHDFLIDPLPNLLFTRDSSVWIRDRVAITSLPSASGSVRRPPASSGSPARCSTPTSPTRCSRFRSPRSGRRCTSTPSARWSTSTRS